MLTVTEAFRKFRSKLELTEKEQKDASRRQNEIRGVMDEAFKLGRDFLTGSYKRHTKTKRLKDVDIFCVFHDDERPKYRKGKAPSVILDAVEKTLVNKYGRDRVKRQRRSVSVQFPNDPNAPEQVMSFDVVPAFEKGNHFEIPDEQAKSGWTETDPTIHADEATAAHAAYGNEWKGMVRMIKRWNREKGKPVKPSFLLEVMALDILVPPWKGDYPYEFMAYFATAADRIFEEWPDPAGLGTPVSDGMTDTEKQAARSALQKAADDVRTAVNLSARGQNGEALRKYQELFGPLFSKT
jgi:hypothetical protein